MLIRKHLREHLYYEKFLVRPSYETPNRSFPISPNCNDSSQPRYGVRGGTGS